MRSRQEWNIHQFPDAVCSMALRSKAKERAGVNGAGHNSGKELKQYKFSQPSQKCWWSTGLGNHCCGVVPSDQEVQKSARQLS